MKLTVTGRFVDLDFCTPVPLKLSQQYFNESVAQGAARTMARIIGLKKIEIYAKDGLRFENIKPYVPPKRKRSKRHGS